LEYDPAYDPSDDEIQYIDLNRDPFLERAIESIPPPVSATTWTSADGQVGHPRSFIVCLDLDGVGSVRFIRSLSAQKEFTPDKGILGRWIGDRFESVDDARTIVFEPSFQAIHFGRFLFVLDRTAFETLFNYYVQLQGHADEVLGNAQRYIVPAQFEELRATTLASTRALKNLRSIAPDFDLRTVSTAKLNHVIKHWNVSIRLVGEGSKRKLSLNPKRPMDLVRLLTDSYVQSPMTDQRYVATSKRRVV
jgi:Domain of unknown function (DUF4868)